MISQRDKKKIIDYPPEKLRTFKVTSYEWIDNLCFTIQPEECIINAEEYVSFAKKMFLEHGWAGDGIVELMWIPPFVFDKVESAPSTMGITIWHVKQKEDGISWILYPGEAGKLFVR